MGTFAPGSSALETEKLMVSTVKEKEIKFKTKVCFSVHEALQAKQLRQSKEVEIEGPSGQIKGIYLT
jgi:hypothetical protein